MHAQAPPAERSAWIDRLPLLGLIGLGVLFLAARFAVEVPAIPVWGRIAVGVLPAPLFLVWVAACVRSARRLSDELERRIQLEALAFAFPCTFALLMGLGLVEVVVALPKDDLSYRHVWAMLPVFYLAGLVLARRRYGAGA